MQSSFIQTISSSDDTKTRVATKNVQSADQVIKIDPNRTFILKETLFSTSKSYVYIVVLRNRTM